MLMNKPYEELKSILDVLESTDEELQDKFIFEDFIDR